MSEQQSQTTATAVQERPAPGSYQSWPDYWMAQGMPWRTESEIDEERQRFLAERRAIPPDGEQGIYPFKDIKLDRADVEWLLATHESGGMHGPVDWSDPKQRGREGLDLRGVDLRETNLAGLPLACLHAGLRLGEFAFSTSAQPDLELVPSYRMTTGLRASVAHFEKAQLRGAHLENACLHQARLQGANLQDAHLDAAFLVGADLDGALLAGADLQGVLAIAASFEDAEIMGAHFEQANLLSAGFSGSVLVGAHLEDADLAGATFSDTSRLNGARLGSRADGLARLVDVRWGGVNVALVRWVTAHSRRRPDSEAGALEGYGALAPEVARLLRGVGPHDEVSARLLADRRALRASQQVAFLLRSQGLNDEADRFAYRAQVVHLRVLRRERHLLRYAGSLLLNLISGYGYRPMRSFITYVLVILAFAAAYLFLGNANGSPLQWNEAIVISMTAFHGRGFFSAVFQPGDIQAAVAAVEAFIGLLIEIVFIATFTQRFFAR